MSDIEPMAPAPQTPASPPPSTEPAAAVLQEDRACARCGYNLRGLRADGLCPECAAPIEHSLQGNMLKFADAAWLQKVKRGIALKLWNVLFAVAGGFTGAIIGALAPGVAPLVILVLSIMGAALGIAAAWLLTAPEPNIAVAEDPMSLRRVVRACSVIGGLGGLVQQAVSPGTMPTTRMTAASAVPPASLAVATMIVAGVMGIAGIVAMFGEFVYLRRFARRVPDKKLEHSTTVVMWGVCASSVAVAIAGVIAAVAYLPALGAAGATGTTPSPPIGPMAAMGVFGCVGGLGFLVFGIWNLALLLQYHARFKEAAASSLTAGVA